LANFPNGLQFVRMITMPATGARVGGLVPVAILVLPPTGGWGLAMRALRTLLASAG